MEDRKRTAQITAKTCDRSTKDNTERLPRTHPLSRNTPGVGIEIVRVAILLKSTKRSDDIIGVGIWTSYMHSPLSPLLFNQICACSYFLLPTKLFVWITYG